MLHPELGSAPSIQVIDRRSVHQICSGQVILTLSTAVKELVENSLDAGSTNVEVKLKDYGSESIEVIDNGSGIHPKDYEAIALKHYTSKLKEFSDLTLVETFGFRGEALSSLSALSNLTIMTKRKSQEVGNKLEFNHDGKLVSSTIYPREQGTSVNVHQLFHTLPVRHKEFLHNIKKEYTKLIQMLQAYSLISNGIRFTCTNQVEKGKKNTILSTRGGDDLKNNVTNIFGAKQSQTLIPISQVSPAEDVLDEFGIQQNVADENANLFTFEGYISRVDHGVGRSAPDRQFYYMNGRPCDLNKVSRMVNEVYHMFNRHQYPFILINIMLNKDLIDINVTPDKRQIFFQHEKILLASLKTTLRKMFESSAANYELGIPAALTLSKNSFTVDREASILTDSSIKSSTIEPRAQQNWKASQKAPLRVVKQSQRSEDKESIPEESTTEKDTGDCILTKLKRFQSRYHNNSSDEKHNIKSELTLQSTFTSKKVTNTQMTLDTYTTKMCVSSATSSVDKNVPVDLESLASDLKTEPIIDTNTGSFKDKRTSSSAEGAHDSDDADENSERKKFQKEKRCEDPSMNLVHKETPVNVPSQNGNKTNDFNLKVTHTDNNKVILLEDDDSPLQTDSESLHDDSRIQIHSEEPDQSTGTQQNYPATLRESKEVSFDLSALSKRMTARNQQRQHVHNSTVSRAFRAKISPDQNQSAEEELRKHISKDMFSSMEVLGQFNLGFIIAKLDRDIFIVDQHASDEKYNFETLQSQQTIKGQRLLCPRPLELTAVNEIVLQENIDIFRKNGFDFVIDNEAPPCNKIKLTTIPTSKNWAFGVSDIEELIFMLSDSPGILCRPSRVRQMFASRACRMSVMVGTALTRSQMTKHLNHMGEIEHPWNCPHGRPTMRHLVNLDRIMPSEDNYNK